MALADIVRLPRNLQRLGEIVVVLARHGFGRLIDVLNLREYVPFAKRLLARRAPATDKALTTEQRLVNVFEDLGTTFIKLGQVLSARPDLVGSSFAEAFTQLRDRVQPFDAAVARRIIEAELQVSISDVFAVFEDEPVGCGSIAQVHRATLKDGADVVVKVRRPGIESAIHADLGILRALADNLGDARFPELRPSAVVDEFERVIRDELDFTVEASNTARFHKLLQDVDGVRGPAVFWELTSSSVLTVERIEGIPISDIDELDRRGHDRKRLAEVLGECFMTQYFRVGTFHADPHAGNMLVMSDGTIGLIDFGMVGHLGSEVKARLSTMLIAAVWEDIDFIGENVADIGMAGEEFDPRQFKRDFTDLFHKYKGMPLGRIDTARFFRDLTNAARRNGLSLPRDLVLLGKSIVSVSGVARVIDPSYDAVRMAAPKTSELLKEKLSPRAWTKHAGLNLLSIAQAVKSIPRDLHSIFRKAESGQLQISFRHRGLDHAVSELDRASNRLAISIYVAALLVASSLMIKTGLLEVRGVSVPGILGYFLAGVLSLWLAWGILRSGRL